MQRAANYLIGEHDFYNFCKPDKDKTTVRRVIKTEVIAPSGDTSLDMCKLIITGQSFIWHQIRCIAAILILIGKELEDPEIILELLDTKKNPRSARIVYKTLISVFTSMHFASTTLFFYRKPQYSMAVDYPLVLYDVQYPESENICWQYPKNSTNVVLSDLQTMWAQHSIK